MSKFNLSISVILPAYNEEENIESVVLDAISVLNNLVSDYEIIIVNDGSTDKTGELAEKLAQKNEKVKVIPHEKNIGYGASLRDGFKNSSFDILFFTDSDRQFNVASLENLLPHLSSSDIVVGYRIGRKDSYLRKFLSFGFNILVSILFNLRVKDIDCAFKVFKKSVFEKIKIESNHFFVNTEILAQARFFNFKITQVGVPHFPRTAGTTTVQAKYIPITIKELFRIRKILKKLKQNECSIS